MKRCRSGASCAALALLALAGVLPSHDAFGKSMASERKPPAQTAAAARDDVHAQAGMPRAPMRVADADAVQLTLQRTLDIALAQAPQLVLGRLEREAQRLLNEAALTMFRPKTALSAGYNQTRARPADATARRTIGGEVGALTAWRAPSGAELRVNLSRPTGSSNDAAGGGRATLELNQPLLKGGWRIGTLERRQIELSERLGVNAFALLRRAVAAEAFDAFFGLYQAQQQGEIATRALQRTRESLAISDALLGAGRIARLDTLQARANVAESELQAEVAVRVEDDAHRRLALLLGQPPASRYRLPQQVPAPPYAAPPFDEALRQALATRLELIDADGAVQSQRHAVERAQDDLWPRLDLSARAEQGVGRVAADGSALDSARPRSSQVGLLFEVPLSRTELRAARTASELGLERTVLAAQERRAAVQSEVRSAYDGLASAERALQIAVSALALQRERLEAEQEKLRMGRVSSTDLTSAQDGLRDAERAELNARVDLVRQQFLLDVAIGSGLDRWQTADGR